MSYIFLVVIRLSFLIKSTIKKKSAPELIAKKIELKIPGRPYNPKIDPKMIGELLINVNIIIELNERL